MRYLSLNLVICLALSSVFGETLETVKLYLPLSLKGTESVHMDSTGNGVEYQVFSTPYVTGGAMPEELIFSLSQSYKIPSLSKRYKTGEANLFKINAIKMEITSEAENSITVRLSVPKDITPFPKVDKLFPLLMTSIRRTTQDYYQDKNTEVEIKVRMDYREKKWEETVKF